MTDRKKTLYDKIWDDHLVEAAPDGASLIVDDLCELADEVSPSPDDDE